MIRFRTLGALELQGADGRQIAGLLNQPKRLALLAYLCAAVPAAYHRRDKLIGLFWPESDQEHARSSLRKVVHVLRRHLGDAAILSRGDEEIAVNGAAVWCDAAVFAEAIAAGRVVDALELYRGDFLDGFFVSGSPEFERWLETTRGQLRGAAARAARLAAERAELAGELASAAGWARRAAAWAESDERVQRNLIALLGRLGDRAGALHAYTSFARRLKADYDAEPSDETRDLVERIRTGRLEPAVRKVADDGTELPLVDEGHGRGWWRRRRLLLGAVLTTIVGVVAWGAMRVWSPRAEHQSVVVLPFTNRSSAPGQEYFVDGIHDALIGELGRLATLRVISRNSAMRYRETQKTLGQIADELQVNRVVEGAVLRSGDSVRIEIQLIQPVPERLLWAGTYEGNLRDALGLIARTTEAIALQLEVTLTQGERTRLATERSVDPVALELFLQGQYQSRLNLLREARASFRQALQRDSTYAPAHAWLALTYNTLGYFAGVLPRDVYPLARQAARDAIRFDETIAEGYANLGWTQAVFDWDWTGAELSLRRAIELNRRSPIAHFWYAHLLHWQRRDAEAIAQVRATIALDPLALIVRASAANIFRRMGRCDLALQEMATARQLERELNIDRRGYFAPDFTEGLCLVQEGRSDAGLRLMERVVQSGTGLDLLPRYKAELAHAYGVAGRHEEARALLRELSATGPPQHLSPYLMALAYSGVGDRDSTFVWLERAYEIRDNWLPFLNVGPRWEPLRQDARFQNLLRRINL